MTNENEFEKQANLWLKMQPAEFKKNEDGSYFHESTYRQNMVWQAAIKSQQLRIDLLESAIREFLKADDELIVGRVEDELNNLRKLMENKS